MTLKKLLASFLCLAMGILLPWSAFARSDGYKVTYDGGSVSEVKTGAGLKLRMDGNATMRCSWSRRPPLLKSATAKTFTVAWARPSDSLSFPLE